MRSEETAGLLQLLVGRTISRMRRTVYVVRGDTTSGRGVLEIRFSDGGVFTFDVGADGEALKIDPVAWRDPFSERLSEENRAYVEECGKWTAVDVTGDPDYQRVAGRTVTEATELRKPRGVISTALLKLSEITLRIEVEADELYITIA